MGLKLYLQHSYEFTTDRTDLDENLVEAKTYFTLNLVDVGKKSSELYKEINELGIDLIELEFKNLYIVIGGCIVICCIVSFLIIPLQ